MLLAVGDSITAFDPDVRDDAEVAYRPWPLWVAEELDLDCETYAQPGAGARDLLGIVFPEAEIGALYIGVNDVRSPAWDALGYSAALTTLCSRLAEACERTLLLTVPLDLGRPRAGAKVADCNALIREQATRIGAGVCALEDFAGDIWLQDDAVHPTASGQRELARRVVESLA